MPVFKFGDYSYRLASATHSATHPDMIQPAAQFDNQSAFDGHSTERTRMHARAEPISVHAFQPFTQRRLAKTARIFVSYSHLDRDYKEALCVHLAVLERQGHHVFADTKINEGKFDPHIQQQLDDADIVLFLLSANFFNSDYILEKELSKVLRRNQINEHRPTAQRQVIIPVWIKDFNLQALSNFGINEPHLNRLMTTTETERTQTMVQGVIQQSVNDIGDYLIRPYYKDHNTGTGYLKPIQRWADNEKDLAYSQIVQRVRQAIKDI